MEKNYILPERGRSELLEFLGLFPYLQVKKVFEYIEMLNLAPASPSDVSEENK